MEYKVNVLDQSEKYLIKEIVSLFLNNKSYEEIANIKGKDIEYIKWTLSSKFVIRKVCEDADDMWELIKKQKKSLEQAVIEETRIKEYKELMDKILFYLLNSLYNYEEISNLLYIEPYVIKKMLINENFIVDNYGNEIFDELKKAIDFRKRKPRNVRAGYVLVKDPKYRSIIKKDVIVVSKYQHALIEKVALFFDYAGNTEDIVNNTEYRLNEINASLNDSWLKDALTDSNYQKLQTLLKIDTILTQNKISERNLFIENIILITYKENGDINKVSEITGYSNEMIKRILNHPTTPIMCKKLGIDTSIIKTTSEEENNKKLIKR